MQLISKQQYTKLQETYSLLMVAFIIGSTLLLAPLAHAQSPMDSLRTTWQDEQQHDTVRLEALAQLVMTRFVPTNLDSIEYFAEVMMDFARDRHPVYVAKGIQLNAIVASERGDLVAALDLFEEAMSRYGELGYEDRRISALSNVARTHGYLGNIQLAIKYYNEVLDFTERKGDEAGLAPLLNNLGIFYLDREDYKEAERYFLKSVRYGNRFQDVSSLSIAHSNLALMHAFQGNADSVFRHVDLAEALCLQLNDSLGLAGLWARKGILYQGRGEFEKALSTFQEVLAISESFNHPRMIVSTSNQMASLYIEMENYRLARQFAQRGLEVAIAIPSLHQEQGATNMLYRIEKALGNQSEALRMYERSRLLLDSMLKEENQNELIHQEYRFKYLEKAVADSVRNVEANKVKDALLAKERMEKERYQSLQIVLFGGIVVLILFLAFVYNRFRVTSRQKKVIESQKKQIEEGVEARLELERMKQDRLKADLTNAAQEIIRRQDWLEKFKAKLYKIKSINDQSEELNKVFVDIANQMQMDARSQEFYKNIEKVNQEFFQRLHEQFPEVTPYERELSGLIRLNLSTKDIADIRNVEPSSIRVARSRLRKKLGLATEENMEDFLQKI